MGTGSLSYPSNRPICAVHTGKKGKLAVIGSVELFMDDYFDKEDN
jgi:intraflagellar transport protein 52